MSITTQLWGDFCENGLKRAYHEVAMRWLMWESHNEPYDRALRWCSSEWVENRQNHIISIMKWLWGDLCESGLKWVENGLKHMSITTELWGDIRENGLKRWNIHQNHIVSLTTILWGYFRENGLKKAENRQNHKWASRPSYEVIFVREVWNEPKIVRSTYWASQPSC